jgi:hypothetical protein
MVKKGGRQAYARLGASGTEGVDPDVLGHDGALLVELEVLVQLQPLSAKRSRAVSRAQTTLLLPGDGFLWT